MPREADYATQVRIGRAMRATWFRTHGGIDWLIPIDTSDETLVAAMNRLGPPAEPDPRIREALYRLWLVTKHEKMAEPDRNAMLDEFTRRLTHLPGHLALLALSDLSHARFFPSWAQIEERVADHMSWRGAFLWALNRARSILPAKRKVAP